MIERIFALDLNKANMKTETIACYFDTKWRCKKTRSFFFFFFLTSYFSFACKTTCFNSVSSFSFYIFFSSLTDSIVVVVLWRRWIVIYIKKCSSNEYIVLDQKQTRWLARKRLWLLLRMKTSFVNCPYIKIQTQASSI